MGMIILFDSMYKGGKMYHGLLTEPRNVSLAKSWYKYCTSLCREGLKLDAVETQEGSISE